MKDLLASVTGVVTSKLFLWALGLALIVGGTLVVISRNRDAKLVDTGREAGAAGAVVAGQQSTLGQVGAANEAENDVRAGRSSAAFDQCVRDSAPGYESGCARYRPVEPVPRGS